VEEEEEEEELWGSRVGRRKGLIKTDAMNEVYRLVWTL
jgi:hypothetical protein